MAALTGDQMEPTVSDTNPEDTSLSVCECHALKVVKVFNCLRLLR